MPKKRITVELPEQQQQRLRVLADVLGITLTDMTRIGIVLTERALAALQTGDYLAVVGADGTVRRELILSA